MLRQRRRRKVAGIARVMPHANRSGRLAVLLTLLLLLLVHSETVSAETSVSGTIAVDTTWALADSPITVVGNVVVEAGVTLTVEAGVTVQFDTGKALDVNGTLIAQGTAGSKITFASSAGSPAAGDWKFIRFGSSSVPASFDVNGNYTSGSILQHCTVEYAGAGSSSPGSTPAIRRQEAAPFVAACTIRHNADGGIGGWSPSNTTTKITNSTFDDNGAYAIQAEFFAGPATVTIDGNTVSNSTLVNNNTSGGGDGITLRATSGTITGTVSSNTISGNNRAGIRVQTQGAGAFVLTVSNNSISNNGGYGLVLADEATSSPAASYVASSNTIRDNGGGVAIGAKPNRSTTVITSIDDNLILNNGGIGVAIGLTNEIPSIAGHGDAECSNVPPAHQFTVSNNTIVGQSSSAIYQCFSRGATITGNRIHDNGTSSLEAVIWIAAPEASGELTFSNNQMTRNTGNISLYVGFGV